MGTLNPKGFFAVLFRALVMLVWEVYLLKYEKASSLKIARKYKRKYQNLYKNKCEFIRVTLLRSNIKLKSFV